MASSTSLAARLCRSLISFQKPSSNHQHTISSFFSSEPSPSDYYSDESPSFNSQSESIESVLDDSASFTSQSSSTSSPSHSQRTFSRSFVLEDGIDIGIYKAILVGRVGQTPLQKRLKNGNMLTLTTVGTGGIRNERIPFTNEEPREYADRCNVQWHRIAIYPYLLGDLVMKHAQPGSILYLEGNLETKIFTDQATGIVRRVREIAIRRNGRVVFLGNGSDFVQPSTEQLRGVGYF